MKRMNLRNEEHGFISVSGSAYHGLLKLRHDAASDASRRSNQCVATQQQIRRDVIPATSCPIKQASLTRLNQYDEKTIL